jgi:NADH dehydrogenase
MTVNSNVDTIVVFGGTGFIGSYLLNQLAKTKAKIILACRNLSSIDSLKLCGYAGQISAVKIDFNDTKVINSLLSDSTFVINLIGTLFDDKKMGFDLLHIALPQAIAKAARHNNARGLIHISALGVDKALTSQYALSKLKGEKLVLNEYPDAVIVRPGIVLGQEDKFLNLFRKLADYLPLIPIVGNGANRIQPVYVDDLAIAIAKIALMKYDEFKGQVVELAGPRVYSFGNLIYMMLHTCGYNKRFLMMPFNLARLIALILKLTPFKLLTVDQVELLKYDNTITKTNGFTLLGLKPTPVEIILTRYKA